MSVAYAVVVPSVGRASLQRTLRGLADQPAAVRPVEVVVADDRPLLPDAPEPLDPAALLPDAPWPLRVVRTGGRGPAAARNAGWRSTSAPWVAFLDDDVVVPPGWADGLVADLRAAADDVAGVQGRIHVPVSGPRPTDWERSTRGLEDARWATADMAYRRDALEAVAGFDERFPRAYREDADLAVRVRAAGGRLVVGERSVVHPVRPADDAVSVRVQAGAADDALMRAVHGPRWRDVAEAGRGRFPWHVATVAAAVTAVGAAVAGRPRAASVAGLAWAGLTADFARRRIAPGPRPGDEGWADEWRRMATTSVVIPFAAVRHRVRGTLAHAALPGRPAAGAWPPRLEAVLFDRDGTLVHDVPYNGDPERVRLVDGAREAVAAVRAAGLRVGVVTNQSGIGRGLISAEQMAAVHARIEAELGPVDVWQHCPHTEEDRCACRKPVPGMVLRAAAELGVRPAACAVVGDIGADVDAALAAGARAVLVPTPATRAQEVAAAPVVAVDLREAVAILLDDARPATPFAGARGGDPASADVAAPGGDASAEEAA